MAECAVSVMQSELRWISSRLTESRSNEQFGQVLAELVRRYSSQVWPSQAHGITLQRSGLAVDDLCKCDSILNVFDFDRHLVAGLDIRNH